MNCANHADVQNAAFCIRCGKPLCEQCVRRVQNSIYCESCLSESVGSATNAPPVVSTVGGASPEAAFLLGLIPRVGAIYNGEYFKAAFNLLIFASLVTLADNSHGGEGLFVIFGLAFYFYMAFEA